MLAITHHIIVQTAASRTGLFEREVWFEDYAVLGDDVVIGNSSVASSYLALMSDLGVDINLSKSVVSTTGSLEFAKRTVVEGVDLSPIGPKQLLQSANASSLSLPLIMDVFRREGRDNRFEIIKTFQKLPKRLLKYSGQY
jgi:hypothetical protein